jgi:hypothetical protein
VTDEKTDKVEKVEKPENKGFELQVCGSDLVVVFERELDLLDRPAGGKGAPAPTGKKAHVFDEKDLIERIEMLKELRTPYAMEKRALGELRLAVFSRGLNPSRDMRSVETVGKKTGDDKRNWILDVMKAGDRRR